MVRDAAGNTVTAPIVLTRTDYTPPTVTGKWVNANATNIANTSNLSWQVTWTDASSGIASRGVNIWSDKDGNESNTTPSTNSATGTITASLHEAFALNATGVDLAGNVAEWRTLGVVAYEVAPNLTLVSPKYTNSTLTRVVEFRFNATVPGHASEVPDEASVTLWNETWNTTVYLNGSTTIALQVNTSSLSDAGYNATIRARSGRVTNVTTLPVLVKPPATALSLYSFDTLTLLPSLGSAHRYTLTHHSACDDDTKFTVKLTNHAGLDVNLYVDYDETSTDGSLYTYKADGAGSTESLTVTGAELGHAYQVLVKSNSATPAGYSLQWGTPQCGGAGVETWEPAPATLGELTKIHT